MRSAKLTRIDSSDQGTFGVLITDSGFTCRTGELPWHDNQADRSCIPPGKYNVTWRFSAKHGDCYHVENVPGRTNVEIHSANLMGDKDKGFQCQLLGCIAPGLTVGRIGMQKAVLSSRAALGELELDLGKQPFLLVIEGPNPSGQ